VIYPSIIRENFYWTGYKILDVC